MKYLHPLLWLGILILIVAAPFWLLGALIRMPIGAFQAGYKGVGAMGTDLSRWLYKHARK